MSSSVSPWVVGTTLECVVSVRMALSVVRIQAEPESLYCRNWDACTECHQRCTGTLCSTSLRRAVQSLGTLQSEPRAEKLIICNLDRLRVYAEECKIASSEQGHYEILCCALNSTTSIYTA